MEAVVDSSGSVHTADLPQRLAVEPVHRFASINYLGGVNIHPPIDETPQGAAVSDGSVAEASADEVLLRRSAESAPADGPLPHTPGGNLMFDRTDVPDENSIRIASGRPRILESDPSVLVSVAHALHAERPQFNVVSRTMPWDQGVQPLARCESAWRIRDRELHTPEGNLRLAVETWCAASLGANVELYTDPKFAAISAVFRGSDGWIPEAYVTFVGLHGKQDNTAAEADLLAQSVHHFSDKPLVVVNFNDRLPDTWTPERFPKMVLLHGRPLVPGNMFFFNKFRAMMFSKVKNGILVDADQWVNRGFDVMFQRSAEETTFDYPYPIMPVHWMSRDPESDDYQFNAWKFKSADAPRATTRWGHAHPTWTHYALPFLSKWSSYVMMPHHTDSPAWLQAENSLADEETMNFGLWAEKATKQWCKFDIPSPDNYQMYEYQSDRGLPLIYHDRKWFPRGIPMLFFSAHNAKIPAETYKWLTELWSDNSARGRIYYNGTWFQSGEALMKYDPSLKCMA